METINSKPIVLVVDDSPDSLGMINTALDEAGLTVLVSLNGIQALAIVEQIEPTVILMDAVMPGMDGFETCAKLKKILPLTPIIFMTGLTETEHIISAFNAGGVDYITKPINPDELIARIKTHINNSQLISNARSALDITKQHMISCDTNGNVLWLTPQAQMLVENAGANGYWVTEQLPKRLNKWLADDNRAKDLIINDLERPLTFQYFKQSNTQEHLIRLTGSSQTQDATVLETSLPITKRESEVLFWISQGKTNREIATILSLSHRTINKHLEQIFPKLNVDNRTSAATAAIKALSEA